MEPVAIVEMDWVKTLKRAVCDNTSSFFHFWTFFVPAFVMKLYLMLAVPGIFFFFKSQFDVFSKLHMIIFKSGKRPRLTDCTKLAALPRSEI